MEPIRFNSCRLSSWFRRFGLLGCALLLASCDPGAYKRGYSEGLAAGFQQGRANGLAEGYANGRSSGLEEGFANGFKQGRAEGHRFGKKDGYIAGQKAFFGDHWLPSVALAFCSGLGIVALYVTVLVCKQPAAWFGNGLVLVGLNLRDRLFAKCAQRRFSRKLKKQGDELAAILEARSSFACAMHLRKAGLMLSEEVIQTKVRQFINESLIISELAEKMSASISGLEDTYSSIKATDEISPKERLVLWTELAEQLDLDESKPNSAAGHAA